VVAISKKPLDMEIIERVAPLIDLSEISGHCGRLDGLLSYCPIAGRIKTG